MRNCVREEINGSAVQRTNTKLSLKYLLCKKRKFNQCIRLGYNNPIYHYRPILLLSDDYITLF